MEAQVSNIFLSIQNQ